MPVVNCLDSFLNQPPLPGSGRLTGEISDKEWKSYDLQEVGLLLCLPIPMHWTQDIQESHARNVIAMNQDNAVYVDSPNKSLQITSDSLSIRVNTEAKVTRWNEQLSQLSLKKNVRVQLAKTAKVKKEDTTRPGVLQSGLKRAQCLRVNNSLETSDSASKHCETSRSPLDDEIKQTLPLVEPVPGPRFKSRIPLSTSPELTCRGKLKLPHGVIVRRKSFLKKGDGLIRRRKTVKQLTTKSSGANARDESKTTAVGKHNVQQTRNINSFLCLSRKKDDANSTFVMGKIPGRTCCKKSPKGSSSNTGVTKIGKKVAGGTAQSQKKTTSTHARKQWSDSRVKSYEGMIFSSIFAFSDELRESTDVIYAKLQSLHDSLAKTKSNPVFTRKSNTFSREWRQNNEDILNSGNQDIAGIFQNLRKVESNLKTIDQAVSVLLKLRSRENLIGLKNFKIIQKGMK